MMLLSDTTLPAERVIPGHKWVGQNWAGGHSTNLSLFVDLWYVEHNDYNFAAKTCTPREDVRPLHTRWSVPDPAGRLRRCHLPGLTFAFWSATTLTVATLAPTQPTRAAHRPASASASTPTLAGGLCLRRDQCAAMYTGGGRNRRRRRRRWRNRRRRPWQCPVANNKNSNNNVGCHHDTFDRRGRLDISTTATSTCHGEEAKTKRSRVRRGTDGGCRCAIHCLNGGHSGLGQLQVQLHLRLLRHQDARC
uniref:FGE-sulfatase domain-containing protein n=1 Tax=Macrostomum lignano TaxID=282301 RepID=A0A1I8F579_9PLAT